MCCDVKSLIIMKGQAVDAAVDYTWVGRAGRRSLGANQAINSVLEVRLNYQQGDLYSS